jgi:hypothetical protein
LHIAIVRCPLLVTLDRVSRVVHVFFRPSGMDGRCSARAVAAAVAVELCIAWMTTVVVATRDPTAATLFPSTSTAGGPRGVPWPPLPCPTDGSPLSFAVVVYGGTAGGVVAAVASARTLAQLGDSRGVAILNPTAHLGGMVSGGLGKTDGGPSGGIAAEFFKDVGGLSFPPSRAEHAFNALVRNASVTVFSNCTVETVTMGADGAVETIVTSTGGHVKAPVFIDASCECSCTHPHRSCLYVHQTQPHPT